MSPKTERLEMRLDPETIERVDAWRSRQGDLPSRSEAVRRLVEAGLTANTPEGFQLNKTEKLMTWLLSEVLKNQYLERTDKKDNPHDMKTVDLIQEAIYGGHFWALDWELSGIMHNHADDPRVVRLVTNILDMWWFIETAYAGFSAEDKKRIEDETGHRGKSPRFLGFDGNNESEYLGIARFLVEKLGRFESFKGRDFNSHLPTVSRYAQMARAFEPMRALLVGRGLTSHEVVQLLKPD